MAQISKDSTHKDQISKELSVLPVSDVVFIQNEISTNLAPIIKQKELLQQFFRQNAGAIRSLLEAMNRAVETYRNLFDTFGDLQRQIARIEQERETIIRSIASVAKLWNQFVIDVPPGIFVGRSVQERPREITLSPVAVEDIADRIFEKIEGCAIRSQVKQIGTKSSSIIQLPSSPRWENIVFAFLNEFEAEISYGSNYIGRFGREDLGFVKTNTNDKIPNQAWWFLLMLSTFQNGKNETRATVDAIFGSERFKKGTRNAVHATKSILSKHLSQVFGINEECFYNYSEYDYYRPKFRLLPPTGLRGNGEIFVTTKEKGYDENFTLAE